MITFSQYLNEISKETASALVGARERENQKNPSSKGYRQQAKNIIRRNVLTKDLSSTERAKVHAKGKEKGKELHRDANDWRYQFNV